MSETLTIIGIYGSPRAGGNTDTLMDAVLEGAEACSAEISRIYARELDIGFCLGCGACLKTGRCVRQDKMQQFYPRLLEADVIFLGTPIYFYSVSAQVKKFIDRCQALWSRRMIEKPDAAARKVYEHGRGYLVAAGGSHGANLFTGAEHTARYFFDALDKSFEGGLTVRGLDAAADARNRPEVLEEARALGRSVCA